jgi:hypothetical protein
MTPALWDTLTLKSSSFTLNSFSFLPSNLLFLSFCPKFSFLLIGRQVRNTFKGVGVRDKIKTKTNYLTNLIEKDLPIDKKICDYKCVPYEADKNKAIVPSVLNFRI